MKNTKAHIVVETVIALSQQQEKELKDLLKKKFGVSEFTTTLNPNLLGGIRITVGSTQYDASLQGKLSQLRSK